MGAVSRACGVIAVLITVTSPALAQPSPPATTWLVGGEAAAYRTSNPRGGTAGLGGTIALDRSVSQFVTLRVQGRGMRMVETADPLAVCFLQPGGGCWPNPVFPDQTWDVQAGALVRLWHAPRLWAVLTAGVTAFVGARESRTKALHDRGSRARPTWRGGVELALGSSRRAPRLQYVRSMYDRPTLDLTGTHGFALLLPF